MHPAKKAKLDLIQEQLQSLVQELEEKLKQKDEALQAAMALACGPLSFEKWANMPAALRNDATALTQAIVGEERFRFMKRSEVSEQVLQEALPNLLENYRLKALRLCEDEFLQWEEVNPTPDEWSKSVYLSTEAFRRGLVQDLAEVPALTNPVLANVLKQGRLTWDCIPTCLQDDPEFCRMVLDPGEMKETDPLRSDYRLGSLASNIFDHNPELCQDRQVWERLIIHSAGTSGVLSLFQNGYLPPYADLIEHACNRSEILLTYVDQLTFADMVRKLINKHANTLFYVSTRYIEVFPDFVASKLADVRPEESHLSFFTIERFVREIPPTMWTTNDDFVNTWFQVGLPLVGAHPSAWRSDTEKLLSVAQHCPKYEWKQNSFYLAPEALKGDITFITRVMQSDPCLFRVASETLRRGNYELAVWALGDRQFVIQCCHAIRSASLSTQASSSMQSYFTSIRTILTREQIEEYLNRASRELDMHNAFVKIFLCAVCISDERRMHLELQMLNQPSLLQAIGEFVGLARGNHLLNIRNALSTISALAAENQENGGD